MTAAAARVAHTLALDGVGFSYARPGLWSRKASKPILRDIHIAVTTGTTTGLVGESGSGKSTIAKLMLGLQTPGSGRVHLDGQPLQLLSARERARVVQMVFQDPYSSLNPRDTVQQILTAPLKVHHIGDAASRSAAVRRMMDAVGLVDSFAGRYPRELSGGQRQRVAIARALMLEPRLLICDEPTSALDVSVQSQILNLLLELQRDRALGYLFISHNLAVVQHISDDVVVLQRGEVVERGAAAQVYFEPHHPYTRALVGAALAVP